MFRKLSKPESHRPSSKADSPVVSADKFGTVSSGTTFAADKLVGLKVEVWVVAISKVGFLSKLFVG